MDSLKPCPFCGNSTMIFVGWDELFHFVYCDDCGAKGGDAFDSEDAKIAWNTRVKDDGSMDRI